MPEQQQTFTAHDIAISSAKRLAGCVVQMDERWVDVVAARGIELTDQPGQFTIDLENGQRFLITVTERGGSDVD